MAVYDAKNLENGKGGKLPDAVVEQTHRINALRQAIADISGCFDGSKHVWITLLLCRYLVNRLRKYHIATKDIAAWGWVVYQTICALYLSDHPEMSDEGCANKVAGAVEKLFQDGVDTTALRAQLYRPMEQNWLPRQIIQVKPPAGRSKPPSPENFMLPSLLEKRREHKNPKVISGNLPSGATPFPRRKAARE